MALSEFAIKNANPREKAFRLSDGDGLHLPVQSSGSKLWQLRYKHQKKENILSFGRYPIVSLAEAMPRYLERHL
ncbi:Arm DNA-binding domain-containing protein [Oricola sp.]|uniref:Arm DNA-binding domain-containing protein n=1 Tax=Oricola sp. TaxID=1979950 RepID=UPI0025CC2BD2|nr:Arm DNA-binding domain-containing protein [Oricola sp.]MCI5078254.1 Arm DNA-binding domain-containing protein [Oricola sp.]